MHNNPFLKGKEDAMHGGTSKNPYPDQTEKWAMYNKGFNLHNPATREYFRNQQLKQQASSKS